MPRRAQRVSADLRRQAAQGPVNTGAGRPSGMLFQVLSALCVCRLPARVSLSLSLSLSLSFCAPSAKTDRRFGAARWRRPLARSASAQPIGAGANCAVLVARVWLSGIMQAHHACDPGSTPGVRNLQRRVVSEAHEWRADHMPLRRRVPRKHATRQPAKPDARGKSAKTAARCCAGTQA